MVLSASLLRTHIFLFMGIGKSSTYVFKALFELDEHVPEQDVVLVHLPEDEEEERHELFFC